MTSYTLLFFIAYKSDFFDFLIELATILKVELLVESKSRPIFIHFFRPQFLYTRFKRFKTYKQSKVTYKDSLLHINTIASNYEKLKENYDH